jgi:ribosomal protein S18 acetylase RimI-like enzyme
MTMSTDPIAIDDARRLEEYALNASGASQAFVYDGWLLGARRGPSKRLRCVNPLYASTLPLPVKVAYCEAFYDRARLLPLFRLLSIQPRELDTWLDRNGWQHYEPTGVMHLDLAAAPLPPLPAWRAEFVAMSQWVDDSAVLHEHAGDVLADARTMAARYPLPQAGALIRDGDEVVATGVVKLEDGVAGIFGVATDAARRNRGYGRAIVAALIAEARRQGATRAYLQVAASNAAAIRLYTHFGFVPAYDYWYRRRAEAS